MEGAVDAGHLLLDAVQNGDKEAFGRLYDQYAAALNGVILKIVGSGEVAEEVLQDTFLKVWRSAKSYDPAKGRAFTWMVNIARNAAIDRVRSSDHREGTKIQSIDKTVYRLGTDDERARLDHLGVGDLLRHLKPELREMIDMGYYQGWSQQEIADRTGLPLGTVKSRTRTALQALKEVLKDHA